MASKNALPLGGIFAEPSVCVGVIPPHIRNIIVV